MAAKTSQTDTRKAGRKGSKGHVVETAALATVETQPTAAPATVETKAPEMVLSAADERIVSKGRALLMDFVRAGAAASMVAAQAQEEARSTYALAVEAAIACGNFPRFNAALSHVEHAINSNEGGIAVQTGCKLNKDGKTYALPQVLKNAKNVLKNAFAYGVELTDKTGKPVSFRNIRKAADIARGRAEQARIEREGGDNLLRARIAAALDALKVRLPKMAGADLAKWAGILIGDDDAKDIAKAA